MRTHNNVHSSFSKTAAAVVSSLVAVVALSAPAGAAVVAPEAKSDCGSGYFCVWSGTGFSGTIQRFSATNSYRSISLSFTRSYYNHRADRTWLHELPNGAGSSKCVNPGASASSTSGWQTTAEAVYLATITTC